MKPTVLSKVLRIWMKHYLKIGNITLRKISYDRDIFMTLLQS